MKSSLDKIEIVTDILQANTGWIRIYKELKSWRFEFHISWGCWVTLLFFYGISPFHLSSMLANDVQDLLQGKINFTCGSLTRCLHFMACGRVIGRM